MNKYRFIHGPEFTFPIEFIDTSIRLSNHPINNIYIYIYIRRLASNSTLRLTVLTPTWFYSSCRAPSIYLMGPLLHSSRIPTALIR